MKQPTNLPQMKYTVAKIEEARKIREISIDATCHFDAYKKIEDQHNVFSIKDHYGNMEFPETVGLKRQEVPIDPRWTEALKHYNPKVVKSYSSFSLDKILYSPLVSYAYRTNEWICDGRDEWDEEVWHRSNETVHSIMQFYHLPEDLTRRGPKALGYGCGSHFVCDTLIRLLKSGDDVTHVVRSKGSTLQGYEGLWLAQIFALPTGFIPTPPAPRAIHG